MSEEGYAFRLSWAAGGHVFLAMERGLGDTGAWRLLDKMRQRWEARFGEQQAVTTASAAPFASSLATLLSSAAAGDAASDELGDVNERLEAVKTVMADSIEKVVERGERISTLVDRAERLEENAHTFAKSSVSLRRTMRWRALRWQIGVAAAVCALLLFVLAGACGGVTLPECRAAADAGWKTIKGAT